MGKCEHEWYPVIDASPPIVCGLCGIHKHNDRMAYLVALKARAQAVVDAKHHRDYELSLTRLEVAIDALETVLKDNPHRTDRP